MNCSSVTPQGIVVCRLCMKSHEYFVNIFISNESCEVIVEEAIQDVLGLPVAVGDGLPNHVCRLCVRKLIEFREFKNMCFKSATELRAYALGNDFLVSKIKDEDAADVETSREGTSQDNTFLNDIQVTGVYVTTPDELAIGNVSHAKEELWSTDNGLVVKEEVSGEDHHIEGNVAMNALTSFAVDPLAVDTMALKEEAREPKVAAVEGNSLDDSSPHNHVRVTEVFVPFPDELALGIVRYAEEDSRPTELIVNEEIGEGLECSENDVPVVSLSSVNVDPLAVDTTIDIKVDNEIKMNDCSLNIKARREDDLLEKEGSGKECSGSGAPLSATEPDNEVDCCYNVGGITEVPEIHLNKVLSDRRENSQKHLPINSSYGHMREENLQVEYPTANSLVSHCHSGKMKKRKKNNKHPDSNKMSSLSNDLKQLKCDACGKKFRYRSDLKIHSVIHTGVKLHKCDVCGKMFAQKCQLKTHSITHTGEQPFKCNVCGNNFTAKSSLKEHLVIHSGVKPFKCNVCGKYFTGKRNLGRHLVMHTGVKPFKCNVCGKNFSLKGNLKKHLMIHTIVKPFKCNVCGKNFFEKSCLQKHLVVHTGVMPFKCNVCGKNFRAKSILKEHLGIHTGVRPFKCNVCGKIFGRKSSLNKHLVVHTGVIPFKCDVCGKSFRAKSSLQEHLGIHTDVRPFKCNVCGKILCRKSSLKTHLVTHTGVKPYNCALCGKTFTRSGSLARHSVVHTGERPFKCDVCGKTYTVNYSLKEHLLTHTGVKPFNCNVCGRNFTGKGSLKRHLVIHTGVKPYKCAVCGKTFTRRVHLARHSVIHTS